MRIHTAFASRWLRAALYFLASIIVAIVIFVGWLIYIQIEIQSAIVQWERVGGGINVLYNSRRGPDEMFLGSMPGIRSSSDLTAIRNAAVRLTTTGGCRKLRLAGLEWSCGEIQWMLSALHLEQLSLSDMSIDQKCVNYLARRQDIRMFRIGGGLSADAIRTILRASPDRRMDLSRRPLSDEDISSLQREFQDRIRVF